MKFSTRRKSKSRHKAAFGSALLLVSAFAVFNPQVSTAATREAETSEVKASDTLSARGIFEKLQSQALEILPPATRLDMLDYWDVDSIFKASNVMEGLSWLENVTPDYLKVRITPVSSLEIKILPAKQGHIVMTIYTVGDDVQAQDSRIDFYSPDLTPLSVDKYFQMPQLKDFFYIPKGSATKMKEIEDMIPFPTVAYTANPDNNNLEARLTVEKYINEDDWNIARLFVKPSIILEWKKDKHKYK